MDIVITLKRPEGNHRSSMREVQAIGRFDGIPEQLFIELTLEGYVSKGTNAAVEREEAYLRIYHALPSTIEEALDLEDLLAKAPGVKRTTAQNALTQLEKDEIANQVGKGVKNDPKRYYRVKELGDSFCRMPASVEAAERSSGDSSGSHSAATHPHPADGNGAQA